MLELVSRDSFYTVNTARHKNFKKGGSKSCSRRARLWPGIWGPPGLSEALNCFCAFVTFGDCYYLSACLLAGWLGGGWFLDCVQQYFSMLINDYERLLFHIIITAAFEKNRKPLSTSYSFNS